MSESISDVVVVGSGGAALSAALSATVAGASVTLLERTGLLGGTTAISGGGMWLPGVGLDPSLVDDSENARKYLDRLTRGRVPAAVLDRYIDEAAQIPTRLSEYTPLTFSAQVGRPDYHAEFDGGAMTSRTIFANPYDTHGLGDFASKLRRPLWPGDYPPAQHWELADLRATGGAEAVRAFVKDRIDRGIVARGCGLAGGLLEGGLKRGVKVFTDVRARELLFDGDRVSGVTATKDGSPVRFRAAKAVVLASGGFEWNQELWAALVGTPWDGSGSPPINEGDALVMASRAGARLANLNVVWGTPLRYLGEQYEGKRFMRIANRGSRAGEILVNRAGRRFVNEGLDYHDVIGPMTLFDRADYEFKNHPCFAIADGSLEESLEEWEAARIDDVDQDGELLVKAPTLEELAMKLGIDPDGLKAQVREYNEHAVNGVDPAFGRETMAWGRYIARPAPSPVAPITQPPFIGYRVRAGTFGTLGGPVINENAQIVSTDGAPIPGLYGAGNAAASVFGGSYPGGGGTLGPAVTMGWVAGASAASA